MGKQRWAFSFAIMFAVIMLTSSFASLVQASAVSSTKALPDFIEGSIAMMYPNATASKLAEVRAQWVEQLKLREERIAATNGAVLNFQPSMLTDTGAYMSSFIRPEAFGGGQMINGPNMVGLIDYNYARFYTPGLGQGVGVADQLSSDYSHGDVYVVAKLGPTAVGHTGNYLIVWGSNSTADWTWVPIGYAQITYPYNWPYAAYHYVGPTGSGRTYKYVSVTANTVMGDLDVYNDVLGDIVWFTSG